MRGMDSLDLLVSRLGRDVVVTDPAVLHERAIDRWTLGLLRRARGDELPEPAAVIFPGSTDEVATALAWASETRTAVIPRGGGSGVSGGAQAGTGSVVLDLSRMDRVTGVDTISQTVSVEAGTRGDRLEDALAQHDLTVGHYPQSIAISTVGGWIAASSAGQASTAFGAIEDVLLGLTAVTPQGDILRCRPVPRSAAGPDLRRLLVGSEGTLAVVTAAVLSCRPLVRSWEWLACRFGSFDALCDGLRLVAQADTGVVIARGYDETDAQLSFAQLGHQGGCVCLLGFPANLPGLRERQSLAQAALRQAGASGELGTSYGEHWWAHRNDAVQTYAAIMGPDRVFGTGVIVDTIEVAGLWSAVPGLYEGIRTALSRHAEAVVCHLSHLYRSGSSLYFTFLIRADNDADAETRYLAAWADAATNCAAMDGTLTHHHGVGRLKAPFLMAELGPAGVAMLGRIRSALDPDAIMNPAALRP
jgi:alkyldihydroxyacetonephosphate synthase